VADSSKSFRWTVFIVALLLFVSLVAIHIRTLSHELAQLEQQLGAEKSRRLPLAAVQQQFDEYQRLKEELERQLNVTTALVDGRTSPLSAMAALESVLGRGTGVRVQSLEFLGNRVRVSGEASSPDDATGYRAALERAGFSCSELSAPNDNPGRKETNVLWNLNCVFSEREQASSGGERIGDPGKKAARIYSHE
jgi:Tfp pilus assembly protein PilN